MKGKLSNLYILITVLYQGLFVMAMQGGIDFRLDRFLIGPIILCNVFFALYISILKNVNTKIKLVNLLIQLFVLYYFIAAIIHSFSSDMDLVTSYLPTVMLVLPSCISFFVISYLGYLSPKKFSLLTFIFLMFAFYLFYQVYTHKVAMLGDNFYKQSNSSGYYFVLVAPLLVYNLKNKKYLNIFVLSLLFIFVLFSVKRGAILIYGMSYLAFMIILMNEISLKNKVALSLVSTLIIGGILLGLWDSLEQLLFRFSVDGGSGRDSMYSEIIYTYKASNFKEFFFGHGFFSVTDVTKSVLGIRQMAHSDFLEVIFDLGLLGFFIYVLIILTLVYYILKLSNKYKFEKNILLVCMFIWIVKALISGLFMVKDAVILMAVIGVIIGFVKKNQINDNEKNTINCSK